MTILGWQLNSWSDAAFHFVLGYEIVNFCILVVPFKRALVFCFCFFLVVANSGYFTVFTPHIYFIILISMIASNLVEIRLPKIQSRKCLRKYNLWRYSRKCLRKFNFNEIRSPGVISLPLASTQGIFSFHDVWNILFRFSLSYLCPFVGCGVFSLCNLLLSVSWAAM